MADGDSSVPPPSCIRGMTLSRNAHQVLLMHTEIEGMRTEDALGGRSGSSKAPALRASTTQGGQGGAHHGSNGSVGFGRLSGRVPANEAARRTVASSSSSRQAAAGPSKPRNTSANGSPASPNPSNVRGSVQFDNRPKVLHSEPGTFVNFYSFVDSDLPFPIYNGGKGKMPDFPSKYHEYSWRAQEMRINVLAAKSGKKHREFTSEEIQWWNRLVRTVKKYPNLLIPRLEMIRPPKPKSTGPPNAASAALLTPPPTSSDFVNTRISVNPVQVQATLPPPELNLNALPAEPDGQPVSSLIMAAVSPTASITAIPAMISNWPLTPMSASDVVDKRPSDQPLKASKDSQPPAVKIVSDFPTIASSPTPAADFLRFLQYRSVSSASPAPRPSSLPEISARQSNHSTPSKSMVVAQSQPVKPSSRDSPKTVTPEPQEPAVVYLARKNITHLEARDMPQARINKSDAISQVKVTVKALPGQALPGHDTPSRTPGSQKAMENQEEEGRTTAVASKAIEVVEPRTQVPADYSSKGGHEENSMVAQSGSPPGTTASVPPSMGAGQSHRATPVSVPSQSSRATPVLVPSSSQGSSRLQALGSPPIVIPRSIPVVELPRLTVPKTAKAPAKPSTVRVPTDRAVVSIIIGRKRRRELIALGVYDALRDDDCDDEPLIKRRALIPLRPLKPLPRHSQGRSVRPSQPETVPDRFLRRPGRLGTQEYARALDQSTLLRRTVQHRCGWKGCDKIFASEALLKRHVEKRQHTAQARFSADMFGTETLWGCHWYGCEEPCFRSERDLVQHIAARHVSRVLYCPFEDCEMTSPNISHLSRHVMRHHAADDPLRPLADGFEKINYAADLDTSRLPALPEFVRPDEITTPAVVGSVYSSNARRLWCVKRVAENCFGGDDPVLHVEHPPHMLDLDFGEEDEDHANDEEEDVVDFGEEDDGHANDDEEDVVDFGEEDDDHANDDEEDVREGLHNVEIIVIEDSEPEETVEGEEPVEEEVKVVEVPLTMVEKDEDKLYSIDELARQKARGFKRRWEVVVCIPRMSRSKVL